MKINKDVRVFDDIALNNKKGYNINDELRFSIIENKFLEKLDDFDYENKIDSFKKLWVNKRVYDVHLKKRLEEQVIKNEEDYLLKTFETLANYDLVLFFENLNNGGWDRIHYNKVDKWAVIITENGDILTSYSIYKNIKRVIEDNKEKKLILKKKERIINETRLQKRLKTILNRLR